MSKVAGSRRLVTISGSSGTILHDNLTDYPVFTQDTHHKIHEGDTYQCSAVFSLGTGGQKVYHVVTANTTTWDHLNLTKLASPRGANSNVTIYHSSTVPVGSIGTGVTLANLNVNSDISHITSVYEDPSVTATGTLLHREWIAAGNFSGGTNQARNEVILKQNASHLIIYESEDNSNDIGVIIQFYENNNI